MGTPKEFFAGIPEMIRPETGVISSALITLRQILTSLHKELDKAWEGEWQRFKTIREENNLSNWDVLYIFCVIKSHRSRINRRGRERLLRGGVTLCRV